MAFDFNSFERKHLLVLFHNELDFLNKEKWIMGEDYDDLGKPAWYAKFQEEIDFVQVLAEKIKNAEHPMDFTRREMKHIKVIVASESASLQKRKEMLLDDKDELPAPHWIEKLEFELMITENIMLKINKPS